jgi:hypothetical protein
VRRAFLLILFCCVAKVAFGQQFGPVETRNLRSLSVPFFRFTLREPVIAMGDRRLEFGLDAANDIRFEAQGDRRTREDYEIDRLSTTYRQGLGKGWDLTIGGSLLHRGHGGTLDGFIAEYHRLVLRMPHDRDGQPYGRSYVDIPGHQRYGSATSVSDVSVVATKELSPRTFASAGVKLPTGNAASILGSGGLDLGVALNYNVPISPRKHLVLQAGIVSQGRSSELGEARHWVGQEALAYVYRWSDRESLVFQWQNEDSALVTGVPGSDARHSITTYAYERRLDRQHSIQVFFSEDGDWLNLGSIQIAGVGPDFTLGMRYIYRF